MRQPTHPNFRRTTPKRHCRERKILRRTFLCPVPCLDRPQSPPKSSFHPWSRRKCPRFRSHRCSNKGLSRNCLQSIPTRCLRPSETKRWHCLSPWKLRPQFNPRRHSNKRSPRNCQQSTLSQRLHQSKSKRAHYLSPWKLRHQFNPNRRSNQRLRRNCQPSTLSQRLHQLSPKPSPCRYKQSPNRRMQLRFRTKVHPLPIPAQGTLQSQTLTCKMNPLRNRRHKDKRGTSCLIN